MGKLANGPQNTCEHRRLDYKSTWYIINGIATAPVPGAFRETNGGHSQVERVQVIH